MQGDAAGAVGPDEFGAEEGEEGFFVGGGYEVGLVVEAGDGWVLGEAGLGVGMDAHRAMALATKSCRSEVRDPVHHVHSVCTT